MNRGILIGIIVAAVVIGVISVVSYSLSSSNLPNPDEVSEPASTPGKHFTIELSERIEVTPNP